jgi:hypothetical protein
VQEGREQLVAVENAKQNSPAMEDSLARLNYHPTSEAAVNEQINHEYTMSYVYHAMSNYFARDNVGAHPNLSNILTYDTFCAGRDLVMGLNSDTCVRARL